MTTYVTVADVDALLPAGWEGDGDKDRAVLSANTWLTARNVPNDDPLPDAIKQAGALLAQEAANGRLYADSQGGIKRKAVKAGSVESETEYQDNAYAKSGALKQIGDLLRPYLSGAGSTFAIRRA